MGNGWTVPDVIDGHPTVCMRFEVPDNPQYRRAFYGALNELTKWYHWDTDEESGRKIATYWTNVIYWDFYRECVSETDNDDAPYWDDAETAAGEGEGTVWGYENIVDWGITAFLAVAAGAPGAAMFYKTTAPRVRLAFKSNDLGALAHIFIDGILAAAIPTASTEAGIDEIIEVPIDLVQFATDNGLSGAERLIRIVKAA